MSDDLVCERRGAVLVVRLNRPEARNALNRALIDAVGRAIATADSDPAVRAVVLTGTGDRAFCAGMDLREFAGRGPGAAADADAMERYRRFLRGEVTVPVVGAANGTAVAGGFELLLACDLVVASVEARFGLPEVKRGLFPANGSTLLASRIPFAIAMEMMLTGDSIDAERSYALGLVNAVVPPGEVLPVALDFAGRIAANAPLGVAATKDLARLAMVDHSGAEERKVQLQRSVFGSQDAREGALAFVEKRAAQWQGH
jgi:enoyl-CoA hydratase/carnithine racemase